ncbi:transposase [Peribacillus sp. SCS-37]|uniref:transposase n=1 Tax=Paraperibacillus esterisolvens TaxID=3115296 RepID=UPI003905D7B3
MKNRGVQDILIACKDGLSDFYEVISTVFPKTDIQLCINHQIRNSMKYVSWKEQKAIMADLKKIYQALTLEEAELEFSTFKEIWGKKQPNHHQIWETNWLELTAYFSYPAEIKRLIFPKYDLRLSTPVLESQQDKEAYPTDDSLRKLFFWLLWKSQKNGLCLSEDGKNVYHNWSFILGIDWKLSFPLDQGLVPAYMEPLYIMK